MIRKFHSAIAGISGFIQILLGLALLVAFVFFLSSLLASRTSQTVSQPEWPSSQQLSSTPTATVHIDRIAGWHTYTDPVTGLSFKYPENWRTAEVEPGQSARIINTSAQYYRAIELLIEDNPKQLPPRDFTIQRLEKAYGGRLPSTVCFEPYEGVNISGVRVTGFPEGILTAVIVPHGQETFRFTLIEGGEIGGAPASSFPTAREDEQVLFQILDTVEFFPAR
jgi:hypothetical protein